MPSPTNRVPEGETSRRKAQRSHDIRLCSRSRVVQANSTSPIRARSLRFASTTLPRHSMANAPAQVASGSSYTCYLSVLLHVGSADRAIHYFASVPFLPDLPNGGEYLLAFEQAHKADGRRPDRFFLTAPEPGSIWCSMNPALNQCLVVALFVDDIGLSRSVHVCHAEAGS